MTVVVERACPVLTRFTTAWNDALSDADRPRLEPYTPRLVGTRSTSEVEAARSWMACDWLVRTFTVTWLRQAGLDAHADALAALPELTSKELVSSALPTLEEARASASAAWAAARTTAWIARGPSVVAAYGAGVSAALGRTLDAVRAADQGAALDTALDAVRSAALGAGRVIGRGARPPAVLGHAYDTAVDATSDAVHDAVHDAASGAVLAAAHDSASPVVLGHAHDTAVDAALSVALVAALGPAYRAAYVGGYDAARTAIRAAALGEAHRSLAPSVLALQDSAFDLLDRMLVVAPRSDDGGEIA